MEPAFGRTFTIFCRFCPPRGSPNFTKIHKKAGKFAFRRLFFAALHFGIDFSTFFIIFPLFLASFFRGNFDHKFFSFLQRNSTRKSVFGSFCRKTRNLKIISFTKSGYLARVALTSRFTFRSKYRRAMADNSRIAMFCVWLHLQSSCAHPSDSEPHSSFVRTILSVRWPCETHFIVSF